MKIDIVTGASGTMVALHGRFDCRVLQEFRNAVDGLLRSGQSALTVDLSQVSSIDSPALEVLLLARESCERAGGSVVLVHPQECVDEVLKLCHFDRLFQVQR